MNEFFGSLIRGLYGIFTNYGLALIMFTLITRIIFIYFNAKGRKSMLRMQRLTPKQMAIREKYKGKYGDDAQGRMRANQEAQQEINQLFQAEGVSPFGGCLWSLIPMPIMFVLFAVLRAPLRWVIGVSSEGISALRNIAEGVGLTIGSGEPQVALFQTLRDIPLYYEGTTYSSLYDRLASMVQYACECVTPAVCDLHGYFETANLQQYVDRIAEFEYSFLGWNLMINPNSAGVISWMIMIPILSAVTGYMSAMLAQKWSKVEQPRNMRGIMLMMPLMMFFFAWTMPAGIGIFWITGSLYAIVQDYFLTKHFLKVLDAEAAEKARREEEKKAREKAFKEERRREREAEYASGKKKKPTSYKLKQKPQDKPKDEHS